MKPPYPLPLALALEETRRVLRRRVLLDRFLSGLSAGGLLGGFLALALLGAAFLWGASWPAWIPLLLGGGPPLLGGTAGLLRGLAFRPGDLEVALTLDREAGLPDRVATAVEFWALSRRGPFEEAALAAGLDAAVSLDPAEVLEAKGRPPGGKKAFLAALFALASALGAAFLPGEEGGRMFPSPGPGGPAGLERAQARDEKPSSRERPSSQEKEERSFPAPGTRKAPSSRPDSRESGETGAEEPARKSPRTRQGRSGGAGGEGSAGKGGRKAGRIPSGLPRQAQGAEAGPSSGAPTAQGSPGGGAGKPGKKRNRPAPRRKKPGSRKKPPAPSKGKKGARSPLSGGAMAAGTSRMGGRFAPVTHSWKTLDKGGNEDSGGEDQDQEVNEEKRRSRQRGGTQPSLRDRRPPPSRDLSLYQPGDQPGKGRGGPTPPKKDRGTAALILGVPLPDTIKGLPNPGTSRVEQERTSPREAPTPPGRGPRPVRGGTPGAALPGGRAPAGESGVVERYFRRLRGVNLKSPRGAGK